MRSDATTFALGAVAWAAAIPAVQWAGPLVANGGTTGKIIALVVGTAIAASTTPLLARLMGWRTSQERVRGIALALGVAQVLDGLLHFFNPEFYATNHAVGLAAAGNIFLGAGLLGIFSAYQ
jgi:hypothetical protein